MVKYRVSKENAVATSFIFKLRVVSGCQHPDLDFDMKISHFDSLLVEISSLESETPI